MSDYLAYNELQVGMKVFHKLMEAGEYETIVHVADKKWTTIDKKDNSVTRDNVRFTGWFEFTGDPFEKYQEYYIFDGSLLTPVYARAKGEVETKHKRCKIYTRLEVINLGLIIKE